MERTGVLSFRPDPTCPLSQAEDVGKTALCLLTDLTSGVTGSGFVICMYCRWPAQSLQRPRDLVPSLSMHYHLHYHNLCFVLKEGFEIME